MKRNQKLILIILSILTVLLILAIVFIVTRQHKISTNTYKPSPSPTQSPTKILEDIFNNTTTDINNIGGLLANNFGVEWFDSMLEHGDVTLQDTPVCAHVNRKTCTAYSYIRKDMIPMLFMFPGVNSNVPCGILLNAKKIWPLITLMATVDGDTNNRSCCTNESGSAIVTRNPYASSVYDWCTYNTLIAKYGFNSPYVTKRYVVYIPSINKGANFPTSCNGNQTCMYNNSGGNVNQWMMNSGELIDKNLQNPSDACKAGNYKNCFNFTEIDQMNVPPEVSDIFKNTNIDGYLIQSISNDCPTCIKPYLCVFNNSPDANKYEIKEESDRIAVYIGPDGSGYKDLITNSMDLGDIAITQCRFEKKDWNLWINVVKQWYKQLLGILNPDNSTTKVEYNYLLANPERGSYLENEVNLYINPDTSSSEYKTQNSIFQDAIVAFYYTGSTCEEELTPLIGIETTAYGKTFNSNIDRCDAFYNMDTDTRRRFEVITIESQRELVHKVADMFNQKHNKNIPVYKCTADSNSYPNYKSLMAASKGQVTFDQMFQIDN